MAMITFYDQESYRGHSYEEKATGDKFDVPKVPPGQSSVASIWVDKGTWLVYTENYFMGASFLLTPRGREGYKDPEEIKRMAQTPRHEKWKGQVRSLRLVTPGSLMLFDNDFFRGACSVITETTAHIQDSDCQSLIVQSKYAPGSAPKKRPQLDLVFVLDGSGSINDDNFMKGKQFAVKMSRGLHVSPTTVRIGMIQFSNNVALEFKLGDHADRGSVERAINSVQYQYGCNTLTGEALEFAHAQMDWKATKRASHC
ncbi:von Willebrand factor A domain-containing protein 2-like [Branchiostoma floridae x Branchiostoma belcheri]